MSKQERINEAVWDFYAKNPEAMRLPDGMIEDLCKLVDSSSGYVKNMTSRAKTAMEVSSNHSGLAKECDEIGIPIENVSQYWHKSKHYSVFVKNQPKSYEEIRDGIIEEMRLYAPSYPTIKRETKKDPHLLVIDPADIHIGKLCESFEVGEDYDTQIAVKRVREGVIGILSKASSFDIDKILFVIGNDVLHIDNPKRQTTAGTPQDTSGMWHSNFVIAKKLYVEIIEMLTSVADVHVTFNPSNHDFMSGFFLADSIGSWFAKSENVTFDITPSHRKYFRYFDNIIGTTHGDGAKTADLPLLMAQEAGEDWLAKHRYVYTHHVHHKNSKDFGSVCVESLRSPSGTDSWHHRNGYQHSPKAIEGFLHSREYGQIARLTHIF
jgi:deoxycytidine triphosphate deaminase